MRREGGKGSERPRPSAPPQLKSPRRSPHHPHHNFQEMTISLTVPDVLVARAKTGDLEALEALYRAFEAPGYNLARRVLRNAEDAEDVPHETFLELVRRLAQYRGEGQQWGWSRQIAATRALMRM